MHAIRPSHARLRDRLDVARKRADDARTALPLSFFSVAPDTVRQLFEQSTDGGKTWTPTFDARYVRWKSAAERELKQQD